MADHRPKYQMVDRTELNQRIDELVKIREDISRVFTTPVTKISNERKYFVLQDLDEYESYLIMRIAQLKALFKPSEN